MQHLQKDSTSSPMGVTAQVPPPEAKNVDSLTIEGSHTGDSRGQASQPDPLRGNDVAPRSQTESEGS